MLIIKKNFNNHSFIGNSLKLSSLSMIFGISFKVNSVQRNLTRLDGAVGLFMCVLVAAAYFCKIMRNCSIYIFSDVIKSLG